MLKLARWSTTHLGALARRAWLGLPMCAAASVTFGAAGAHAAGPPARVYSPSSVLLAFAPARTGGAFETELARAGGLSVGIMSAAEGSYTTAQLVLDITQGARIASAAYSTPRPPALDVAPTPAGAIARGWTAARRRAEDAPELLRPGLLAAHIPGGGAYAGLSGGDLQHAAVAADRVGQVAAVSLGTAPTLPARVRALLARRRFVVCDLPGGSQGAADLAALSRERAPAELLVVLQGVADGPGGELLWAGVGGLAGDGGEELNSHTTNQRGLIASIDLAPTILRHLGVTPLPAEIRGTVIGTDGTLRSGSLRALMARLRVIGARRLKAAAFLLCGWAVLLLGSALWRGPGRPRARAWALRTGALAVLWAPSAALLTAALEPSAAVEFATITLSAIVLAAVTDALLPWPRAPIAPALVALVALVADALAHWQLLMRSLLGPNPILGARFYGFGNELKSALAVLVLAAVAAALYDGRARGHVARSWTRTAGAVAVSGALLAAIEGWARIGAAVGGVVLVCAGTAVATVMLLPGPITRRRALTVLLSPVAGLALLAALDLATAHGSGHYTGSILHARSAGELRDVLERRYSAAWRELRNHAMPAATAIALLASALALRWRERLLAPVAGDRVWGAALAGGLAAGVIGALVEDSGPVLLVVAVSALGCELSYLWGRPPSFKDQGALRAPAPGPDSAAAARLT
jgi:hypothetical protein